MKFKKGDLVRLRKGLIINEMYGEWNFEKGMIFNGWRIISSVEYSNYRIEGRHYYTDEMLVGIPIEFFKRFIIKKE